MQVSNIIFDRCYPAILPDITFLTEDDKHIIRVTVYRGSSPAYYRKDKGKQKGTYIRVSSSNRLADEEIIAELERRKRNVSFDSELIINKPSSELNLENFKQEWFCFQMINFDVHYFLLPRWSAPTSHKQRSGNRRCLYGFSLGISR